MPPVPNLTQINSVHTSPFPFLKNTRFLPDKTLDKIYHISTNLRSALFWVIAQRVMLITYRRFGTISVPFSSVPRPSKSAFLIYFAAQTWNHELFKFVLFIFQFLPPTQLYIFYIFNFSFSYLPINSFLIMPINATWFRTFLYC